MSATAETPYPIDQDSGRKAEHDLRMGWRGLPKSAEPRFMSRLRNYSVGKRNAIQVAPRFAARHEKRALCGTLNAISNRPREQKKSF